MKTLNEKEKKQEGVRIREEYEYLRNLPLKGWIWEFTRRSKSYREAYERLRMLTESKQNEEELDVAVKSIMGIGLGAGLLLGIQSAEKSYVIPRDDNLLTIILPGAVAWSPVSISEIFKPHLEKRFIQIPKPDKTFIELSESLMFYYQKPSFRIYGSFEDIPRSVRKIKYNPTTKDLTEESAYEDNGDTVFVAFSKKAKYVDLKTELLPQLKRHLDKSKLKRRDKNWIYYLATYDLKSWYGDAITYEDIADILGVAYPKGIYKRKDIVFDARSCQNYLSKAISLIDGDYKKYILPTK